MDIQKGDSKTWFSSTFKRDLAKVEVEEIQTDKDYHGLGTYGCLVRIVEVLDDNLRYAVGDVAEVWPCALR